MRLRVLVCGLLALATGRADAKRKVVIMEPPVVYQCRSAPTWDRVVACLGKLGTVKVERNLATAHLVTLSGSTTGLYLYVLRDKVWQIGGLYEVGNTKVLDAKEKKLGTHTGYQIDLGLDFEAGIAVDDTGVGAVEGRVRTRHTLLCSGLNYGCTDLMVRCEAFARGRSYYMFRGTMSINGTNEVLLDGDRSRAGVICASPEKSFLGWGP